MKSIEVYDTDLKPLRYVSQWDKSISAVVFHPLASPDWQVQFYKQGWSDSLLATNVKYSSGKLTVKIPDKLMQSPEEIRGVVYSSEQDKALYYFSIGLYHRPKPDDYEEPTEDLDDCVKLSKALAAFQLEMYQRLEQLDKKTETCPNGTIKAIELAELNRLWDSF